MLKPAKILVLLISIYCAMSSAELESHFKFMKNISSVRNMVQKYLDFKNMSAIQLPEFNLSSDEMACLASAGIMMNSAFKFLTTCSLDKSQSSSSPDCLEPDWSVRLIDAFPTKPTGLLRKGPFFFMGDYESCKELWSIDKQPVHYCSIKGSIGLRTKKNEKQVPPFTIGICLPRTCRSEMIVDLMSKTAVKALWGQKSIIEIESVYCNGGEDAEWDAKKPFVIAFTVFLFGCITIGTIFENAKNKGIIRMKTFREKGKRLPIADDDNENNPEEADDVENENRSDRTSKVDNSEVIDDDHCSSLYQDGVNPIIRAPSIALTYRSSPPNLARFSAVSIFMEIITSFSIISSFSYLFRNSTREVRLINGIRVITTFWVIFSHTCLFSLQFTDTVRSLAASKSGEKKLLSSFMLNSSLAVDTFLFVSACVVTFSIKKRMIFRAAAQMFSLKRAFAVLIHRILRLLPSLFLYLIFMSVVYNHLADGPFWNTQGMFGSQCNVTSTWPHFVFLSNFFPSACAPWLWHIALDFQLYLIFPLIFWLLSIWRFGWIPVGLLVVAALVYRAMIYGFYTLPMNMFVEMLSGRFETAETSFRLLYTSPISRSPPFLVGILTGWYICRPTQGPPTKWALRTGMQAFAFFAMCISLFGPFVDGSVVGYTHAVIHRTLWSVGLAILIYFAQNGYPGMIGFLSDQLFVVLSRLSFGVFLSHEPILLYFLNTLRQPLSPSSFGTNDQPSSNNRL